MKTTICYPPIAYATIPYLAPYLLKGYLSEYHSRIVNILDVNVQYHVYLWTRNWLNASIQPDLPGGRQRTLMAELLNAHGKQCWVSLRQSQTFLDTQEVRRCVRLLREAQHFAAKLDAINCHSEGPLPLSGGKWQELISKCEASELGIYLHQEFLSGLLGTTDVVIFSAAYVEQLAPALLMARLYKRLKPSGVVILGGNALTHYLPEFTTDLSAWVDLDYAIPFEGEWELGTLLDWIEDESTRCTFKNVIHLVDGAITYQKDLKDRPRNEASPDFSDMQHLYPTPSPVYPILTSKGCYWGRCSFCTHHEGYGQGFGHISITRTIDTLNKLIDSDARYFYFVDEAVPLQVLRQILKSVKTTADMYWMAETRIEKIMINQDLVRELADSGCRLLVSGIESGSQEVIDRMHKGIDLNSVSSFAKLANKTGIRLGWMFFVGFPGETEQQAKETFEFIHEHRDCLDFASVGTFTLERGSPIFEKPAEFGISEVIGSSCRYPTSFEYIDSNGNLISAVTTYRKTQRLRTFFPSLEPLFSYLGDRTFSLFISTNNNPGRSELSSFDYEWYSTDHDSIMSMDLNARRIVVRDNS